MKAIVLVLDSVRFDAVSWDCSAESVPYRADTPNLADLAAGGTRFTHAIVSGSWTIPSLTSMDTGWWPNEVGVCNWRHRLRSEVPSTFGAFAEAGLVARSFVPNPEWAWRGWPRRPLMGDSQDVASMVRALRAPEDGLVFLHWWWTHLPYVTRPAPWGGRRRATDLLIEALARNPANAARLQGLYRRALQQFDNEVWPRLRDAAGPDAFWLVTADHGESWGELGPVRHVFDLHGRSLADATARVPLVIAGRSVDGAVPVGVRADGFARGVDVGATVRAAIGLPPADGPGRDLRAGPLPDHAWTVVSHNTFAPERYPAEGRAMWCRFGRRSQDGWTVWDAGGGTPHPDAAALWARSVGPAPGSMPDPDPTIDAALRVLGYLE